MKPSHNNSRTTQIQKPTFRWQNVLTNKGSCSFHSLYFHSFASQMFYPTLTIRSNPDLTNHLHDSLVYTNSYSRKIPSLCVHTCSRSSPSANNNFSIVTGRTGPARTTNRYGVKQPSIRYRQTTSTSSQAADTILSSQHTQAESSSLPADTDPNRYI
ncbi:hypothetical protein KC19_VG252000 [Ceratodon purpureus]|uniref:Uncharacterized protein n=1 Tax=Ceratodon purpureus TaxID=3225 RepID=A0A8T0HU83_CERPU|nr:hypothetical protein KC19_VG252000 [Ceratodon purpureus]